MAGQYELIISDNCIKRFRSDQTRKIYATALYDFLDFSKKDSIYKTNRHDGAQYLKLLENRVKAGTLSESTKNNMLYRLKSITKASLENIPEDYKATYSDPFTHIIAVNPDIKMDGNTLPSYEELSDILATAEEEDPTFSLLLNLVVYCGMTLQECIRLTAGHIHPTYLEVPTYYTRHLRVPGWLLERLRKQAAPLSPADSLLRNRQNKPYNEKYVQRHIRAYTNHTIQEIRSFALVMMFAYGVDSNSFSKYTGIQKNVYYKRYRDYAEGMVPYIDYSHIPQQ